MVEGNNVKKSLNLSRQLKTTELMCSMHINKTIQQIKISKASLLIRLLSNSYTRQLLDNLLVLYNKKEIKYSLIGEWIDLFGENVRDEGGISLELIYNASKITISEMKNEYLQLLNSETVANIKSLIDNNQTTELTEKLKCY